MQRPAAFPSFAFLIPLLVASVAVLVQWGRLTSQPSEYSSIGRIMMVERGQHSGSGDGLTATPPPKLTGLMGAQIEWIESAEMKHRTVNRVRSLHPELEGTPMEIRVTQTKGSFVLNVHAIGGEPKYTRSYLDALLEEYQSSSNKIDPPTHQSAIMERAEVAVKITPDLWWTLLWAPLVLMAMVAISMGMFSSNAFRLSQGG